MGIKFFIECFSCPPPIQWIHDSNSNLKKLNSWSTRVGLYIYEVHFVNCYTKEWRTRYLRVERLFNTGNRRHTILASSVHNVTHEWCMALPVMKKKNVKKYQKKVTKTIE